MAIKINTKTLIQEKIAAKKAAAAGKVSDIKNSLSIPKPTEELKNIETLNSKNLVGEGNSKNGEKLMLDLKHYELETDASKAHKPLDIKKETLAKLSPAAMKHFTNSSCQISRITPTEAVKLCRTWCALWSNMTCFNKLPKGK